MKSLKNRVGITLDEDIIEKVKHLAEADDRSFSQYVNMILKKYLYKENKKTKHTPDKEQIT